METFLNTMIIESKKVDAKCQEESSRQDADAHPGRFQHRQSTYNITTINHFVCRCTYSHLGYSIHSLNTPHNTPYSRCQSLVYCCRERYLIPSAIPSAHLLPTSYTFSYATIHPLVLALWLLLSSNTCTHTDKHHILLLPALSAF
jgi:hypothetical protein